MCVCVCAASFTFCCRRRRCRQNQIPLLINIRRRRRRHPYTCTATHSANDGNYPLYARTYIHIRGRTKVGIFTGKLSSCCRFRGMPGRGRAARLRRNAEKRAGGRRRRRDRNNDNGFSTPTFARPRTRCTYDGVVTRAFFNVVLVLGGGGRGKYKTK